MQDPQSQPAPKSISLSEEDALVLDAILEARSYGADVGPLPPGSSKRAEKVRDVLSLLETMAVDDVPSDLTERTLESIENARQRARFSQQIDMLKFGRGAGLNINMRQAASAAAVILIAFSLLLPTLSRGTHEAKRIACASNMAQMGQGLATYATAHKGYLPRTGYDPLNAEAMTLIESGIFPRVAYTQPQPNSANLFLLLKNSFVDPSVAFCAGLGQPDEISNRDNTDFASAHAVPFSYQNQITAPAMQIETLDAKDAVLADRNPLFAIHEGHFEYDDTRSPNAHSDAHAIPGQNVLTADMSVRWTVRPVVHPRNHHEDNIWITQNKPEQIVADEPETTTETHDAFLTP